MSLLGKPKLGGGLGKGIKLSIPPAPGLPKAAGNNPTVKSPMKVGTSLTVKTPKPKSMPDATDKPSVFYKSESKPTKQSKKGTHKLQEFIKNTKLKKR